MRSLFKILTILITTFMLVGCSTKSIEMENITKSDVKHVFQYGVIVSSQKVLIDKGRLSSLTYMGTVGSAVGLGAGALIGGNSQGGLIGAVVGLVVGGVIGATSNNEVEAFQVEIRNINNNETITSFLSEGVEVNTIVEYIIREDKQVTNVNIVETTSQRIERLERQIKEEKRAKKQKNRYK